MTIRLLTALLTLTAGALTATAADDENPYKTAKVGDYAKYTLKAKLGAIPLDAEAVQTLSEKSDKEATLKLVVILGETELKGQEVKVDITKPFDPAKSFAIPGLTNMKAEKQKDGKEKVKAGGKEYETTWTTYKISATQGKNEVKGDLKVWLSKDTPLGTVKLELTATSGTNDMEVKLELLESGSKK